MSECWSGCLIVRRAKGDKGDHGMVKATIPETGEKTEYHWPRLTDHPVR
jgi:hypothetical protein